MDISSNELLYQVANDLYEAMQFAMSLIKEHCVKDDLQSFRQLYLIVATLKDIINNLIQFYEGIRLCCYNLQSYDRLENL